MENITPDEVRHKTRITKVNGDVSEMYITIDGKEYHFEFPLKEEEK